MDRKQDKKSSLAVISDSASGTGTRTSKEDIVRWNLLGSLDSVPTETFSSSESPSAVAQEASKLHLLPCHPHFHLHPHKMDQSGQSHMESTSLPWDTTALLHQLDVKASRHQEVVPSTDVAERGDCHCRRNHWSGSIQVF